MTKQWPTVQLGEVLTHYTECIEIPEPREYRKLSVKLYGKGVVLDAPADGAILKMKRHQLAKAGQVILSEIWGKKGAIGFVPPEGDGALCTSHFFLFDVREDKLDRRWLQAIFDANYLQEQLDAEAKGTTGYAAVRPKILLACKIPLPPLVEQQRIVARIEELAVQIHEGRNLRHQATEEAEALVVRTAATRFDSLGNRVRLGDFCETASGGTPSRERPDFFGGEIPWVKSGELKDDFINRAEEHITKQALENSSARLFPSGTLVVALYGANVGKTGVLSLQATTNQAVCAVFPKDNLERDFVWWFLRRMRPVFVEDSFGGAQPNISQRILRDAEIPIPPFPEQRQIVSELDALPAEVNALKRLQAETAAELDALLPAILDKAFKGEL